jgi:hypothetical protein
VDWDAFFEKQATKPIEQRLENKRHLSSMFLMRSERNQDQKLSVGWRVIDFEEKEHCILFLLAQKVADVIDKFQGTFCQGKSVASK